MPPVEPMEKIVLPSLKLLLAYVPSAPLVVNKCASRASFNFSTIAFALVSWLSSSKSILPLPSSPMDE